MHPLASFLLQPMCSLQAARGPPQQPRRPRAAAAAHLTPLRLLRFLRRLLPRLQLCWPESVCGLPARHEVVCWRLVAAIARAISMVGREASYWGC